MSESSGIFICPKCHTNSGIISASYICNDGKYKKWLSKIENNNGLIEKIWFFYKKEEYWYCCSACGESEAGQCCRNYLICFPFRSNKTNGICAKICAFFLYILSFSIIYLFYFLIFLWIDIYKFCNKKNIYYLLGKKTYNIEEKVKSTEIWKKASFESRLESAGPWICLGCKHNSPSFKDFILQSNDLNKTTEIQNLNRTTEIKNLNKTTEEQKLKTDEFDSMGIIPVLLQSVDGQINYAIICKKTEVFSIVEKALLEKFPEYKNYRLFYMQNGIVIDKEKTLEENKITPGFAVLVNSMDE